MRFLLAVLNTLSNIVVFVMAFPQLKKLYNKIKLWFELKFIYRKKDQNWDKITGTEETLIKSVLPKIIPYIPYILLKKVIDKCFEALKDKEDRIKSDKKFIYEVKKEIEICLDNPHSCRQKLKIPPYKEDQPEYVFDILSRGKCDRLNKIVSVYIQKGNTFKGAELKAWGSKFEKFIKKFNICEKNITTERNELNRIKERLSL